jgi:nanoRNase/pAp phosphatase (c-di-AMP/oligoRNAs hydrolase)
VSSSETPVAALKPKARLSLLKKRFKRRQRALVMPHDNPDPDSLASAWALSLVLKKLLNIEVHLAYGGIIGRAENTAFVKVLKIPVVPVSDVKFEDYDLFALVDTQAVTRNHAYPASINVELIVDHHPLRDEQSLDGYVDVGNAFGATSTVLTQYLRALKIEPSAELATALYYGIKADTRDLDRQTSNPDVDSYLWLFPKIDRQMLSEIERPALPIRYFQLYHSAYESAKVYSSAVITELGDVYTPDMVAEVAERLSFLEGMKYSLAWGSYSNQLFLSLRVQDKRINAGRLVREICADLGGSAGGHGSMAGARLPLSGTRADRDAFRKDLTTRFKASFDVADERGASLLSTDT